MRCGSTLKKRSGTTTIAAARLNHLFPATQGGKALRILHRHLCLLAEADNAVFEKALEKVNLGSLKLDPSVLNDRSKIEADITVRENAAILMDRSYKNVETRYRNLIEDLEEASLGAGGAWLIDSIKEAMRSNSGAYGMERFTALSMLRTFFSQVELLKTVRDSGGKYSVNTEGDLSLPAELEDAEKNLITGLWKDMKKNERSLDKLHLTADRFTINEAMGTDEWIRKVAAKLETHR
jgi:hypothetical protein